MRREHYQRIENHVDNANPLGISAADYMIDIMGRKLLGYFNNRVEGHKVSTTPMAGIWGPKIQVAPEPAVSDRYAFV